jgi:hypothetical protein
VVVWWCGGVVVWWCGGVVVWWCGGVAKLCIGKNMHARHALQSLRGPDGPGTLVTHSAMLHARHMNDSKPALSDSCANSHLTSTS